MTDATATRTSAPAPAAAAAIPAPRTASDRFVFPLAHHVQASLAQDVHPATRAPIHPDQAAICGGCAHLVPRAAADGRARTRCALAVSRRGGPDILPIFPACIRHTPIEGPTP